MSLSDRFTKLHNTFIEAGRLKRQTLQNNSLKDKRATQTQGKRGIKGNNTHHTNLENGNTGKSLRRHRQMLIKVNNILNYFLPHEVLCQIFSKFLSIHDVSPFDIAMCNRAKRPIYLECIKSKECLWLGNKDLGLYPHRVSWISNRNINIAHLKCCRAADDMAISFDTFGSSLQWLSLYDDKPMRMEITDKGMIRIIENCPNLQYLDMTRCQNVTDEISASLANYCPGLLRLDLSKCLDISDIGVMNIVEGCRNIMVLNLEDCPNITNIGVIRIAECCQKLQSLNLTRCDKIGDSSISMIAERCQNLETLVLSRCDLITDVTAIAKSCLNLQSLDLSMCYKITESCLINISKWRHNLQILDVSECRNVTETAVMSIGAGCLKLQELTMYKCDQINDVNRKRIAERYPNLKSSSKWANDAAQFEYHMFMLDYLHGDHGDH
mmetsp:Transcript_47/g.59  ORF Transcript_47/g.59 Transcript_47/m.59 type:complete len:439 (-) Transcript_47:197-1513(-)